MTFIYSISFSKNNKFEFIWSTDKKTCSKSIFRIPDKSHRSRDRFHRSFGQFHTFHVHNFRALQNHYVLLAWKYSVWFSLIIMDSREAKNGISYVSMKCTTSINKCSSLSSLCSGWRASSQIDFFKQLLSYPILKRNKILAFYHKFEKFLLFLLGNIIFEAFI